MAIPQNVASQDEMFPSGKWNNFLWTSPCSRSINDNCSLTLGSQKNHPTCPNIYASCKHIFPLEKLFSSNQQCIDKPLVLL